MQRDRIASSTETGIWPSHHERQNTVAKALWHGTEKVG